MKPILVLWLAILMLICLWIVADPASAAEKAKKELKECCIAALEDKESECYVKADCPKIKQ